MKKFLWGILFSALVGVLSLAPEGNFSSNVWNLFFVIQFALTDVTFLISRDFILLALAFVVAVSAHFLLLYGTNRKWLKDDFLLKSIALVVFALIQAVPAVMIGVHVVQFYQPYPQQPCDCEADKQ